MIDLVVMQAMGAMLLGTVSFFWGRGVDFNRGQCQGCLMLRQMGYKIGAPKVEEFDQKVDIVCNACGLVGEFECASCNPVKCAVCDKADCDWGHLERKERRGK